MQTIARGVNCISWLHASKIGSRVKYLHAGDALVMIDYGYHICLKVFQIKL